jgi:hypothetical protein
MTNITIKKDMATDIASEFVSYNSEKDISEFIFPLAKDEIYKTMAIKNIPDLIAAISYIDDIKTLEDNINNITCIIADTLVNFSDDDFKEFVIKYYDDEFSFEDYYLQA